MRKLAGVAAAVLLGLSARGIAEGPAGDSVVTVPYTVAALGYDTLRDDLLVAGTDISTPGVWTLAWLDPATLATEDSLLLPFVPTALALGDDGAWAWVAGSGSILKVDLASRSVLSSFPVGTIGTAGLVHARALFTVPGAPGTVIAACDGNSSGVYEGSIVFDDGVPRPDVALADPVPRRGDFHCAALRPSPPTLYVIAGTGGYYVWKIPLSETGLSVEASATWADSYWRESLGYGAGLLWGGSGHVVDADTLEARAPLGDFAADSNVLPDETTGRVHRLSSPRIEEYDLGSRAWLGSGRWMTYSASIGFRPPFVRTGTGRFAAVGTFGLSSFTTDFDSNPIQLSAWSDPTGRRAATLTWTDESPDESGFLVERSVDGGAFAAAATVGADVTTYEDALLGVVPSLGTCTYRVRAIRPVGLTSPTNEAVVTTDASLGAMLAAGELRDDPRPGRDRFTIIGRWWPRADAPKRLNPIRDGASLVIGDESWGLRADAPPLDRRWRRRSLDGIRFRMWRSSRSATPSALFVFTDRRRVFGIRVMGFDLPEPPTNPVRFVLRVGDEAAEYEADWRSPKPGLLRIGGRVRKD